MHGYEAISAGTIAEGITAFELTPTHLLLDMNLPDGLGTTILKHVRDAGLLTKVAVLSGSGDPRLMAEAKALGPDAIFQKPPDWDAVMRWIAR